MPIDPRRVTELFRAALELDSTAERAAFLDRECGPDAELRIRLDDLLAAVTEPASALERPLIAEATTVGSLIAGRYRVRQEIGEGGMGTVYLAEQVAPVKRLVALKLIRAGMGSRQVLARFESERQALAIMDHPNIARVLDAGTTESGHPFFVMELVKGVPLTDYCDSHRLGLPERLQLFRQICAAV